MSMSHANYPTDWKKRRGIVLAEYDRECQSCGERISEDSDTQLHVHHVRPISDGGGHGYDNLLPLCEPCHLDAHSSDSSGSFTPRERYECAHCGRLYIEGKAVAGSFCSEYCHLTHRAEKQVGELTRRHTVCATCFAQFPRSASVCPNCDNWDPRENNRDALGDVDVDVLNFAREIIRAYIQ